MSKSLKLSAWAKNQGIRYQTAFRWFQTGKIPNAYQMDTGTILVRVPDEVPLTSAPEKTLVYCRVSNQSRRAEMKYQEHRCLDYCAAKGYSVAKVYSEVASGMNDDRRKFWEMLDSKPSRVVIENKDRLTRFGYNYLERLLKDRGCTLEVLNPNKDDEQDLVKDLVAVITSFCCRIYGLRRMKNKLDKIKAVLQEDGAKIEEEPEAPQE